MQFAKILKPNASHSNQLKCKSIGENIPSTFQRIDTGLCKSQHRRWMTINHHAEENTVDPSEILKFSEMSKEWWNPDGPLKTLHHINSTRISYIKRMITQERPSTEPLRPFQGLRMLDLGCGAGVLSEPLARLGANVVAIDASPTNIVAAKLHLKKDPPLARSNRLEYIHSTAEELVQKGESFDVVCSLEVIEHVSNVDTFVNACAQLLKPGGKLFLSTINRTTQSFWFGIVGAEYLLKLIEPGTHDWNKFLTPKEVEDLLSKVGLKISNVSGMDYNPITYKSSLTDNTSVNYLLCATKELQFH